MTFDLLIKNGTIIDGTGNIGFKADIAILNEKISKIMYKIDNDAKKVIDATDLIVCPGFIDMHSHSDTGIPYDNRLQSIVTQGITSSVVGQCGYSLAPISEEFYEIFKKDFDMSAPPGVEPAELTWRTFDEYLNEVEKNKISSNIIPLVGFGPVRIAAGTGYNNREPAFEEMEKMKGFVEDSMRAGAFGLSTGLIYSPQVYAKTDEIIELVKVVAKFNGLYCSHMRNEGNQLIEAIREVIEIVEKSGVRGAQISHFKASGKANWDKAIEAIKLVEDANNKGMDITCDQYPYNRGATSMTALLPPWVHEGGIDEMMKRLASEEMKQKIKKDMEEGAEDYDEWYKDTGPDKIYVASVKEDIWRDIEGKTVEEITKIKGKNHPIETILDILLENECEVAITVESMSEENIKRIMKSKYTSIGTDGWGISPDGPLSYGKPHPRYYGTFPRIIRKYVKEEGLLSLEEAIRKMTSLSAQKMGVFDRGLIREEMYADIVVFDLDRINDKATFEDPHQISEGFEYVIVNGVIVVEKEKQNENLPGKVLRYKS